MKKILKILFWIVWSIIIIYALLMFLCAIVSYFG
jgi:hypothetical protein